MRRNWRRGFRHCASAGALALLLALLGCKPPETRLLIAYSGDCQGYIDPCG